MNELTECGTMAILESTQHVHGDALHARTGFATGEIHLAVPGTVKIGLSPSEAESLADKLRSLAAQARDEASPLLIAIDNPAVRKEFDQGES